MGQTRRDQLLQFVGEHPDCSFPEITRALGVTRTNAGKIVADAVNSGALVRYGRRRLYTYRLASGAPAALRRPASIFHLAESL